uniref:Seminal fluid protein HACP012 n=1 Tax=Heliconius erato TaxID=33431 RepID=D9HQ30_HELEA
MFQKLLFTFIVICLLGQGVYSDTLFNIEHLLKDRDTSNRAQYKDFDDLQRERNRETSDDDQTLNMYLQLNDQEQDLLRGFIERQEDKKCTGDRCGSYERKLADDIDEALGEIKKQINKDRFDVSDSDESDYNDGNDYQNNLLVGPYNHLYHPNEIQQIVPGYQDLTKNEYVGKFGLLPHRINTNYPRLQHNIIDNEKEKSSKSVNPEDFFKFYVDTKTDIITNLVGAVRSLNKKSFLPYKDLLSPKQIRLLKRLQNKYGYSSMSNKELLPQITNIVFGEHSNSRILPHHLNNFKIFVPKWFYDRIVTHKDIVSRSQKLLPLTNRQRLRLLSKVRPSPIMLSRRNFNPNQFGVPFEMYVQGLGQINP